MSGQYRTLIALANVALVGAIGFLGYRAFTGTPIPKGEQAPKDFDPTKLAIETSGQRRSPVREHQVTWQQLDRAKPPPRMTGGDRPPPKPRVQDLSNLYTLVMANYNSNDPGRSTVILQDSRRRDRQITLAIDDSFDGYKVVDIAIQGEDDSREAKVTVVNAGKRHTIALKPRGKRRRSK